MQVVQAAQAPSDGNHAVVVAAEDRQAALADEGLVVARVPPRQLRQPAVAAAELEAGRLFGEHEEAGAARQLLLRSEQCNQPHPVSDALKEQLKGRLLRQPV